MNSPPIESTDDQPKVPRPLRVAIVTRRFWPFAGPTEFAVGDLATALKNSGQDVHILTVRWEKNWPARFEYLELPIHRINRPTGPWASFRYLRGLTRELTELDPDGIIVFGLGEEAWSIAKSFAGKIPFLIRVNNLLFGGRDDQANLSSRQLTALQAATGVLVDSEWTAAQIASHASARNVPLTVVPDGIQIDPNHRRTPAGGGSSRVAMSDAHPILMIEPGQPLVVCGAPLTGDQGLLDLVNAWPMVHDQFRNARLWILGDGKKGRQVWERVVENHLVNTVIMPGSFDDLVDIFQAADVYVHPLRSDECCGVLTRALVSGVCTVTTSTAATESIVTNDFNGLVVNQRDPRELADAIILALGDDELRDRLGLAALNSTAEVYDIKNLLSCFLDPFLDSMIQEPAPTTTE